MCVCVTSVVSSSCNTSQHTSKKPRETRRGRSCGDQREECSQVKRNSVLGGGMWPPLPTVRTSYRGIAGVLDGGGRDTYHPIRTNSGVEEAQVEHGAWRWGERSAPDGQAMRKHMRYRRPIAGWGARYSGEARTRLHHSRFTFVASLFLGCVWQKHNLNSLRILVCLTFTKVFRKIK